MTVPAPPSDAVHSLVREFADRDAAGRALGIEVLEVRAGYARCALTLEGRHANAHGVCHGGVLFTLADSAFGYACNAQGQAALAQAAAIDFIRPGRIGERLTAGAEERARAGRSVVYDVIVATEAGATVAMLRGRSRVIDAAKLHPQAAPVGAESR